MTAWSSRVTALTATGNALAARARARTLAIAFTAILRNAVRATHIAAGAVRLASAFVCVCVCCACIGPPLASFLPSLFATLLLFE